MSNRLLPQTRLCSLCKVLQFGGSYSSVDEAPYKRQDVYPELPELTASADSGCGFCLILKELILDEIPRMRHAKDESLVGQMRSVALAPKRFDIRTEKIRLAAQENRRQNGALGLHHFSVDLCATEKYPDHAGATPETLGGFDMRFDVFADPDNPASLVLGIERQPVENNPFSPQNITLVKRTLQKCAKEHECGQDEPRKLPTRVIDIGEDSGEPRLLITSGQEARYVAFSYQWGDPLLSPPPLKTTKEKLKGYLSAIPTADLPRSFIDLIEITRAIGERYIWIDSLCIVQDDEQDWEREALQMGSVFLNAFLTVVAASITSPHQSFLASRNLWPLVEVPVIPAGDESVEIGRFYISPGLTSTSAKFHHTEKFVSDVGFTEWNKRGWTFQERELSRRILYFGKTQLHFACNEGRWEEELGLARPPLQQKPWLQEAVDDLDKENEHEGCHGSGAVAHYREGDADDQQGQDETRAVEHSVSREEHRSSHDDLVCEDINKMWYKLASDYSSRLLTYEIDRLPAISGLARHLERAYAESSSNPPRRYLSGLWDDDLVPGLMWYVDKGKIWKARSSAKPYLGPSWSWISHLGGVEWHTDPKYTQACEIVNANMGYATGDPMGRVTSGYLTIRGKLLHIPPPPPRDFGFSGAGSFHMERIIMHGHSMGAPYYLDLTYEGKGFGNALFDNYLILDNCYYETAPTMLGLKGDDMAVLLLGWEAHPGSVNREIRRKVGLFQPEESGGNGPSKPAGHSRNAYGYMHITDLTGEPPTGGAPLPPPRTDDDGREEEDIETWIAKRADPKVSDIRFKNARRLAPHNPDDIWGSEPEGDEEDDQVENWPVGLLLEPWGTDTDGQPLYKRIGAFERILQVDNAAARAVFDTAETKVVKLL